MRLILLLIGLFTGSSAVLNTGIQLRVDEFFDTPTHTNNWAVIVCTSRFWFNYRHVTNVLVFYHHLKRLGIPDSNIIMMLAEDIPCNARNPFPGTTYGSNDYVNLYGVDAEVDYRGEEVTVENFVRVLTARHHESTPRSKRLLTDHQSNVLIMINGHGTDGAMKFQDTEFLHSVELANAIQTMYEQNRFNELLLIADSCRSSSMYEYVNTPNVLSTSSSLTNEESYSYVRDSRLGVHLIDRYSRWVDIFLKKIHAHNSSATIEDYLHACSFENCRSNIGIRRDTYPKETTRVRVTDFFGSARIVRHLTEEVVLDGEWADD